MNTLTQVVYPIADSRPVIDFERLVALLDEDRLKYLNAVVASKLATTICESDD